MKKPLSMFTSSRDNNFNLIRFVASILVLFSHSFALSLGSGNAEPLHSSLGMTWGTIAVDIFFITSGFLITSSYFSRKNLHTFFLARVLRIYPALIVAIVFCVFVVGAWFTTNSLQDYLSSSQTHTFMLKNMTLFSGVENQLPGVFLNAPYKPDINSSLWTLPYEVKMYVFLALFLTLVTSIGKWLKFITVRNAILCFGVLLIALHILNHFLDFTPVKTIRLLSMFFMGAVFFIWRDKIQLSLKYCVFCLSILLISTMNVDLFFIVYYLVLAYIVFYVAYVPAGYVRKFNSFGDYSYGIYIYAFPVQQSAAALIPNISVIEMLLVSFLATFLLSMLSWHLIEKPFLRLK